MLVALTSEAHGSNHICHALARRDQGGMPVDEACQILRPSSYDTSPGRIEHTLDTGPDLFRGWASLRRPLLRGPNQVEQVNTFHVVETQRSGNRLEHVLGDTPDVATLELRVVVDADRGQHRHLLAPQPRHTAPAAVSLQARLVRCDPRPTRRQELADLVHPVNRRSTPSADEVAMLASW
jgi:hypothetical protein